MRFHCFRNAEREKQFLIDARKKSNLREIEESSKRKKLFHKKLDNMNARIKGQQSSATVQL